ncbi:hypothetical protein EAE96_009569 [Botrytis aclada]|nr:hypothetical protein EAE96_009569 [Botrytis aclada]
MPGFFGTGKPKAAKSPVRAIQSSSDRPQQERRHSDYINSKPPHRPSLFASRTWHAPTTGKHSSKPPKPPKQNGRKKSPFWKSSSSNDKDDGGLDFECRGEGDKILVRDGHSPSRDNASLQLAQLRVPTRSRSTVRPGSRSGSEDSLAPRKTKSSVTSSTSPKSPYTKLSATSHTNPRSIGEVYRPRGQTELSRAVYDPNKYRPGRDGRNSSRNCERDAKVKSPDGIVFPSRYRNGKTESSHLPPRALADRNYHQDEEKGKPSHSKNIGFDFSNNEHKPTFRRRENPNFSAPKATRTED